MYPNFLWAGALFIVLANGPQTACHCCQVLNIRGRCTLRSLQDPLMGHTSTYIYQIPEDTKADYTLGLQVCSSKPTPWPCVPAQLWQGRVRSVQSYRLSPSTPISLQTQTQTHTHTHTHTHTQYSLPFTPWRFSSSNLNPNPIFNLI